MLNPRDLQPQSTRCLCASCRRARYEDPHETRIRTLSAELRHEQLKGTEEGRYERLKQIYDEYDRKTEAARVHEAELQNHVPLGKELDFAMAERLMALENRLAELERKCADV